MRPTVAAAVVSGLVAAAVLTGAGAAAAGSGAADGAAQRQGGATATLGGLTVYGAAVAHGEGGDQQLSAGLFEMSVDGGGTLRTYGVDLHDSAQKDTVYQETPWSATSLAGNRDAGKILWILRHSYPQVNDLASLARDAHAKNLTEADAAAGTQVAIWRLADGARVEAVDPDAEKLADHLRRSARDAAEPAASLTLDPPAVSGRPGERLGPVTVHTNSDSVEVTPPADAAAAGVRFVDHGGKPVSSVRNGGKIYVDVPKDAAAGSVALTVETLTEVPVGRAFAAQGRSQTQVLAGSSASTVAATATASWAAEGAIPALSARRNCSKGGLDVTAANAGDAPFGFTLQGADYAVAAGASRTVTVPLQEDQVYDFTIRGKHGFAQRFQGVFDCSARDDTHGIAPMAAGGPSPVTEGVTSTTGVDLAETGGGGFSPLFAGTAIVLVLIGGAVLVLSRGEETRRD